MLRIDLTIMFEEIMHDTCIQMIKRYLSQELTPIDSNFGGYLRLRLNDILGRVYCPEKNYHYDLVQRKVASFKKRTGAHTFGSSTNL